jgi:hypothetical protein
MGEDQQQQLVLQPGDDADVDLNLNEEDNQYQPDHSSPDINFPCTNL